MYEQPKIAVPAQRRSSPRVHNSSAHDSSVREAAGAPLAGHLVALMTATEAVREATGEPTARAELDRALEQLALRLGELEPTGGPVVPAAGAPGGRGHTRAVRSAGSLAGAHEHAHALAGRVLLVAAARQDTATAMLACRRMDAHAAARSAAAGPRTPGT